MIEISIMLAMIKEEWRMHSSIFGSFMFLLFPFMIAAFVLIGMASLPIFREIFPSFQIAVFGHSMFLLFGLSVGSFGMMGREIMNRRFGHASLIAYSSRSLPVSERSLFTAFIIKDILFYFSLWILPFGAGISAASLMGYLRSSALPAIIISVFLSFIMGISVSFFLSTLYVHSRALLLASLASIFLMAVYFGSSLITGLPSITFMENPNIYDFSACVGISALLFAFSIAFLKIDYPENKRQYENHISSLAGIFSFSRHRYFMAKDFLDMARSEGGIGKILFSFFFPLAMIWFMLTIFIRFVPLANPLVIFSIFLGVISSTVYNWLTEFDLFSSYSFLPIRVSDAIKSKLTCYFIINIISVLILIGAASFLGQWNLLFYSLLLMMSISTYSVSVVIFLTGLHPNIMLYNARIFVQYIMMNSALLLVFIFLSLIDPIFTLVSLLLVPVSLFLLKNGFEKWDKKEQLSF